MPIFRTKNEHFFKKWTPEMAYVLGFFTADGSMIKNKRGAHFIEFQITDKRLLYQIRELLESNHKITKRNRNVKWKKSYRLQIGSKVMFNDLIALGLMPAKSKIINFPTVPNKYLPHFIRGYFDGDGNILAGYFKKSDRKNKSFVLSVRFTSGSRKILISLMKRLHAIIDTKGSLFFAGRAWRLSYSINDSKKLFHFIYNNNKTENLIFLERKYKIFQNAGVA